MQVLSSYYWNDNSAGVPDGLSDCSKCVLNCETCHGTKYVAAHSATSCGYDDTYTRVHRDVQIVNAMRSWMKLNATSTQALGLAC